MKILLVTGNYLPGKNGGIENYTHWIATVLLQQDFIVEVAALNANENADYLYEGVKVNNLGGNFSTFENLVKKGNYDICHFQEYAQFGGIEIHWFTKAKEYCGKIFFTFHLPYFTCYKGDFRHKGIEDCNTFTDVKRCSECVIADKTGFGKMGKSELYLSLMKELMMLSGEKKKLEQKILIQYQLLNKLITVCDEIFIYANWFKNILAENGFDSPIIKKIPYKTKSESILKQMDQEENIIKTKLLFVGRIQHQKGLHLLCRAMNKIETKNICLDVYGNIIDDQYFEHCKGSYSFNFKGTTNYFQLLSILKEYDFLVLPSVFTEMYSLIIKDSFYEKLPVIASTAKGNKDALTDGVNGFLFEYDNAVDLAITIDKAYQLKSNGWKPKFSYPENPQKDIEEIVSYYH